MNRPQPVVRGAAAHRWSAGSEVVVASGAAIAFAPDASDGDREQVMGWGAEHDLSGFRIRVSPTEVAIDDDRDQPRHLHALVVARRGHLTIELETAIAELRASAHEHQPRTQPLEP